ncbi:P-loop containing nucleoside triphosphate hydrolase protein [Guyanagaster necrorhizus]|uniref:P-loop containing nucleoside triphosphate hydrolase protein n=1 Tax=Guyanagaster necrorhizus TaxID=856835 RepID=A0A9P7VQA5_9AGAR|nr:P-loop containing nucleoside triphosphate hydrolase protein [Guyanagaster necrorhizus MCA 3950]KAG7444044.1 P-loop containing nucleoside triphosphate hydrolase protein [Guyanagaster necrorhizus MCA 3950]
MSNDGVRIERLSKLLNRVLRGTQTLTTSSQYSQFLEAICLQPDPPTCIDKIIASKDGLASLRAAFRSDLSLPFLNGRVADALLYLQAPEIKTISSGQFLTKMLQAIVDPPIFWDAFVDAFKTKQLLEKGQKCFAWLLLQLILIPSDVVSPYVPLAEELLPLFIASPHLDIRNIAQKVKNTISVVSDPLVAIAKDDIRPGGRHDNDFPDFREIAILPTAGELASTEASFLRPSTALDDPSTEEHREALYLDNQFRLMREDMIHEMREELQLALGKQKGRKHRGTVVDDMKIIGISLGDDCRRNKWAIVFRCSADFPQLQKIKGQAKRKASLLKDNTKLLKHQSLTTLLVDGEVLAFPSVRRDEDLLAKNPPEIVLEFEGETSVRNFLLKMKSAQHVKLIQIEAAVFSYEPILTSLKRMKVLPLAQELLFWKDGSELSRPSQPLALQSAIWSFGNNPGQDLQTVLSLGKSIVLDKAQAMSLLSGLKQNVSIIQGPPGTGKSFIGALLAKFIHDFSDQKILVVCYTNHALDQFLEDLLDIGIPIEHMVRIGGKFTLRTEPMVLRKQPRTFRFGHGDHTIINELKADLAVRAKSLPESFKRYLQSDVRNDTLLAYLEFEEQDFYNAFYVPLSEDGMRTVGGKGRAVDEFYLLQRWRTGQNAGVFLKSGNVRAAREIWDMSLEARRSHLVNWEEAIRRDEIEDLYRLAHTYNCLLEELDRKFHERDTFVLQNKRIIGCTTTAAAKYGVELQSASPDVVLVEEAGEILESHVVAALGTAAKQLILIGDHKQLRPKVNNYQLTVEKGKGYDLNRSLFERLVLKGYPHHTLVAQHRMRPEISALIRHLTYPDLLDAPKTQNRPHLRGIQDDVVFINHGHPEDDNLQIADRRDLGSKSSKQNTYEARMVLKIVKYLAQQGYGTDKVVVLTPYLGQLSKLRNELREDTDPVLNDLDSYDLIRAGLLTAGAAKSTKKSLRLATIDNYQGEESDIVVVSLTRSNPDNDIGFMCAPERLNVLLSRARNALIMIGNSDTFTNAKKGKELWRKLFDLLKGQGHIYDGLPVRCEQHPDRTALLSTELQFDTLCPDGGCSEPCGTKLSCGLHVCPSKCHQLYDHSKMACHEIIPLCCLLKGHDQSYKCSESPALVCKKCERDAKVAEAKRQKDFDRQKKRDEEEAEHLRRIKEIEDQLAEQQQVLRDTQVKEARKNEIRQKMQDLKDAAALAHNVTSRPPSNTPSSSAPGSSVVSVTGDSTSSAPRPSTPAQGTSDSSCRSRGSKKAANSAAASSKHRQGIATSNPSVASQSDAEADWQYQKDIEGASNQAIDAIMDMIGLEAVKKQILRIKAKIDVFKRQNTDLSKERFNVVFLGNPGTGKTTVARHYAKFLASLQVLPGLAFEETTGSRLANDGVQGAKKLVEGVINAGGGAIFVDESYQLTSEHNFQGSQVLDFLLAEMENNVGRIVFILAGYNKQMEKFFEHNPGLPSRVPYRLQFEDYKDEELLSMLEKILHKKYAGRLKVEEGIRGLYGRIAIKRLGRGRGKEGFGNARALENALSKITERQAERLGRERRAGHRPDDLLLLKEDLIGPDPSEAIVHSESWTKLKELIGLASVKASIQGLYDTIRQNYQRELQEKEPVQSPLNRVFLGSPGTGKTTVAKLYGKILADLGILSNGEVVVKNPADFVGSALGESEKNTKAILATTVGKVLIIDEAYGLYGGGNTGQQNDPYKTAVIDTIVAEVQSTPGEDRCVLLLGYKQQIEEMFQNVNPGLSRRFAIEDAFNFDDFSTDELREILDLKLKSQDLQATEEAKKVALEVLGRAKIRPNFGNAGEVENMLSKAKANYMTRVGTQCSVDMIFQPADFDPAFDRGSHADVNIEELFKDVVGCDDIVAKLRRYQKTASAGRRRGQDVRDLIPTSFVFKGPPVVKFGCLFRTRGTGKTTTARKMGQVYFDMGFLGRPEVIECSASDIIAQYVGQTGPLVRKMFEKALGQVLFIDEAYRLKDGVFAKEAIDEIVDLLTQERIRGKIVVILAGYDEDINELLSVNRGLSSRFPEEIVFQNLWPEECLAILSKQLKKKNVALPGLDDSASGISAQLANIFEALSQLPSWGNARDVITISQKMISIALQYSSDDENTELILDPADAATCLHEMLISRQDRSSNLPSPSARFSLGNVPPMQYRDPNTTSAPNIKTSSVTKAKPAKPKPAPIKKADPEVMDARDPGVSDATWNQLQMDKAAEIGAAKRLEEAIRKAEEEMAEAVRKEAEERERVNQLALAAARQQDFLKRQELKRQREAQRLKELRAREERERREAELRARKEAEEKARKEDQKAQAKLRTMGLCVAGYRWIKQDDGYRCAGGYHFVSNAELGL